MIKLFKRTSKVDRLQKKYIKTLEQYYELSKVNRAKSDSKFQEAQQILEEIELFSQQ